MDIKRGLLRIWIVLSVAWAAIFLSFGGYQQITTTTSIPLPPKQALPIKYFRKIFPQFNKFSDEMLAKGLYERYYKDVPYSSYAVLIGFFDSAIICSETKRDGCSAEYDPTSVLDPTTAFNEISKSIDLKEISEVKNLPYNLPETANKNPFTSKILISIPQFGVIADWRTRREGILNLALPPVGIFVISMAAFWVVNGFRRGSRSL